MRYQASGQMVPIGPTEAFGIAAAIEQMDEAFRRLRFAEALQKLDKVGVLGSAAKSQPAIEGRTGSVGPRLLCRGRTLPLSAGSRLLHSFAAPVGMPGISGQFTGTALQRPRRGKNTAYRIGGLHVAGIAKGGETSGWLPLVLALLEFAAKERESKEQLPGAVAANSLTAIF